MVDLIGDIHAKRRRVFHVTEKKCARCGEVVSYFRDVQSRKEFLFSGLCQKCQDEEFDILFDADEDLENLRHEYPN